jgi:hypothetical protein
VSLRSLFKKPVDVAILPTVEALPAQDTLTLRQLDMKASMGSQDPHPVLLTEDSGLSKTEFPPRLKDTLLRQGYDAMEQQMQANQHAHNNAAQQSLGQQGYGQNQSLSSYPPGYPDATQKPTTRLVIETVTNGFTVQCGQDTYVAGNIEELASVVKLALVKAKLLL